MDAVTDNVRPPISRLLFKHVRSPYHADDSSREPPHA